MTQRFLINEFGGAGGLHVCEIADGMQMKKAVIPVYGGVLSALGMLVAEQGRQFVRTVNFILGNLSESEIEMRFAEIFEEGRQTLTNEGINEEALKADYSLDCRYRGQSYTLNIPWGGLPDARCVLEICIRKGMVIRCRAKLKLSICGFLFCASN